MQPILYNDRLGVPYIKARSKLAIPSCLILVRKKMEDIKDNVIENKNK